MRVRSEQLESWFSIYSLGHHGYPEPGVEHITRTYADACPRCGTHGAQVAPFRVKAARRARHSDFLQLNWCFDAFFVRTEVAEAIREEGLGGVGYESIVEHRSGTKLLDRVQLTFDVVESCVETSRLPAVTCRPNNEESFLALHGEPWFPSTTPYCGSVKHHPPNSVAVHPEAIPRALDVFQTAEWFGSGGAAFRLTLCSQRFVEFVEERRLRGIGFRPVTVSGYSLRDP